MENKDETYMRDKLTKALEGYPNEWFRVTYDIRCIGKDRYEFDNVTFVIIEPIN